MPVAGDDSKAYSKNCKFWNQGLVLSFEMVIREQETWNIIFQIFTLIVFQIRLPHSVTSESSRLGELIWKKKIDGL